MTKCTWTFRQVVLNPVNRILSSDHSWVRLVDKKIDPDLFARLMQLPARARKDLLEYIGQGPLAVPPVDALSRGTPLAMAEPPVDAAKPGTPES